MTPILLKSFFLFIVVVVALSGWPETKVSKCSGTCNSWLVSVALSPLSRTDRGSHIKQRWLMRSNYETYECSSDPSGPSQTECSDTDYSRQAVMGTYQDMCLCLFYKMYRKLLLSVLLSTLAGRRGLCRRIVGD